MVEILAHRALFNGREHSIDGIKHYVNLGIGVEIDIRSNKNGVYISHDKQGVGELFENVCKVSKNLKTTMALHIKEIEAVKKAVNLLEKYSIKNYFLFDTDQNDLSKIIKSQKIGKYINKKPIKSKQKILWCDEVHDKWYDKELILELHKNNNFIYAVSLEIFKKCSKKEMITEWKRLIELGIDGICTDFPEELMKFSRGDLN